MIEAAMIWNEPNNKSHWDPGVDPEWALFAEHVIRAGAAIREINPALPRVLGGMSPIDPFCGGNSAELVDQLVNLRGGGADHLDIAGRGRLERQLLERAREAVDGRQRRQNVVAGDRDELSESAVVRHCTGLLRSPGGPETNADGRNG